MPLFQAWSSEGNMTDMYPRQQLILTSVHESAISFSSHKYSADQCVFMQALISVTLINAILSGLLSAREEKKSKGDKSKGEKKMKYLGELQQELDFQIKPSEAKVETIDTSQWPLLLKVRHCSSRIVPYVVHLFICIFILLYPFYVVAYIMFIWLKSSPSLVVRNLNVTLGVV